MKQLTSDKIPPLHTRVLLPLQISGDKDPELEVSEGTVTTIFVQYQIKVLILTAFTEIYRRTCAHPAP